MNRMYFYAIHWNDEGIQGIVDMTSNVEEDLLNKLRDAENCTTGDYAFPWMLMRARNTPEKNPKVYGFQSEHELAFLEYVWKNDPETLIKGVLQSGVSVSD